MSTPVTIDQLVERMSPVFEKKTVELVAEIKKGSEEREAALRKEIEELKADQESRQTSFMAELARVRQSSDAKPTKPEDKGIKAAQFVRALAAGKGDPGRAERVAKQWWGDDYEVTKALGTGTLGDGGAIVPESYRAELIELLRARSIVRSLGPVVLPMPNGTLTIPKLTAGATAGYIGESESQNATQQTLGQLKLVWKKLRSMVPASNELLRFSSPQADQVVRDDMVQAMATAADQAFIRGTGLSDAPKGLRYWAPAANVAASAGLDDGTAPVLAEVETDLRNLVQALEGADVRMIRPAFLMAPRSKNFLLTLRDANGNLAFPEIRGSNPMLWSFPIGVSNNIPTNLAGAGAQTVSELYFVDMADAVIGEATMLEVDISNEASYTDSGGTVRSSFDRDETVIRTIERHDFGMRHDASVAVRTSVVYGAI